MQGSLFSHLVLDDSSCFLCGGPVDQDRDSQEHVFPKWLQRRYDLWDKRLGLLNGTSLAYRELRIPCCAPCNGGPLSDLEKIVAAASDYEALSALNERLIYLWVGKLFYGILRKELSLPMDRARRDQGGILPEATLRSFANLHLFLQGIRGQHTFVGPPPYSVLLCHLHDLGQPRNFSFRDQLVHMTAAIRMGDAGMIVAFEDDGLATRTFGCHVAKAGGRKLHPIQFDELYAKVAYQSSLWDGRLKYLTTRAPGENAPMRTEVFGGGYVQAWSQADFAKVLRAHVGMWTPGKTEDADWCVPPDLVPTWLADATGDLLLLTQSQWEGAGVAS